MVDKVETPPVTKRRIGRPKGSKNKVLKDIRSPVKKLKPNWRKGTARYDPSVCEKVVQFMKKGYGQDVISAHLGVSTRVFHGWMERHRDFRDAVEEGKRYSQLWWETQGIKAVQGQIKGFNASVWIFCMKNKFGWREKQEISGDEDRPVTVRVVKFSDTQEKVIEPEWKKIESVESEEGKGITELQ